MPEAPHPANDEAALAVPGLVHVNPITPGKSVVSWGRAAGWLVPRGIQHWERELSFVVRTDLTPELARKIRATLPSEQIAPRKYPWAAKAAEQSPILPVAESLSADLRKEGVRVHTVGVDRVSAGFFYFAEGGAAAPVQVQGNLVEMLAPALSPTSTNEEIAALMEDLVDRLLTHYSGGLVTELHAELADALPRLSRDGTGLVGTDLDAFEAGTASLAARSASFEADAPRLVETLRAAEAGGGDTATIPLYGKASREVLPALEVQVEGARLRLPERYRWLVTGKPAPTAAVAARIDRPAEPARGMAAAPAATKAVTPAAPVSTAAPTAAAVALSEPTAMPVRTAAAPPVATPMPAAAAVSPVAVPAATATPPRSAGPSPSPLAASAPAPAATAALAPVAHAPAAPAPSSAATPTPLVPIQPMAIAMIGVPSDGAVAVTNDTTGVDAVLPSSSAIELSFPGGAPPSSEMPAAAEPTPPSEAAPVEASPSAAAPVVDDKATAKDAQRRKPGRAEGSSPGAPASTQAALAPAGRRSPAASLGFFLAIVLFAIAYLGWRWMHHHPSPFHLPLH